MKAMNGWCDGGICAKFLTKKMQGLVVNGVAEKE